MSPDVVLEARGLVKDYRRARAVDGIDLVVHAGERVALLGPNGAGKTTTLLMILGVVSPDAGSVTIVRVSDSPSQRSQAASLRRVRGGVPAAHRAHAGARVPAAVRAALRPDRSRRRGSRKGSIGSASTHLADAMGTELSSGQRTLIGIVRATLHRPRLLVLDEPTASLDPDVALRVRDGTARPVATTYGCALLMTSHDMSDVEQVCERVVFLSQGRVVADGTPARGRRERTAAAISKACSSNSPTVTNRRGAQQSDHP